MAMTLMMLLLAGTTSSLAPEPTRTFVAAAAKAGVTVGAIYFVSDYSYTPVAPMPMPPPPAPPPRP